MPRPGVILQARMGSSRLPGKVLRPLAGRPIVDRVIGRLRHMRGIDTVVLATTALPIDDLLAEHGERLGAAVFRGSDPDVLDRYYQCARALDLDPIVRATGDNPFVDPEEGDRLLAFFRAGNLDYAVNSPSLGGGLPLGVGLEAMSRAALDRSWREGRAPHHRKHVNEYAQEHSDLFHRGVPPTPAQKHAPELRLTVDTQEDFALAERLVNA